MNNDGRLYSQVAAQAGVSPEKAMIACYLVNLSKAGKTMDEAASLLRKDRADVREYARDWGISFSDYMTSPKPLRLEWVKPKRGRWELHLDGLLIAVADTAGKGDGSYIAKRETAGICITASSAEIAIRKVSMEIERRAVEIFGLDDVEISLAGFGQVAPKQIDGAKKYAEALAA